MFLGSLWFWQPNFAFPNSVQLILLLECGSKSEKPWSSRGEKGCALKELQTGRHFRQWRPGTPGLGFAYKLSPQTPHHPLSSLGFSERRRFPAMAPSSRGRSLWLQLPPLGLRAAAGRGHVSVARRGRSLISGRRKETRPREDEAI